LNSNKEVWLPVSDARRTIQDPELVELFGDDPGGLAVVDAIAATQRRDSSQTKRVRIALLAAAVVAAAVVVGALTDTSSAGVIEKAMKALRYDRVIRLVIDTPKPGAYEVNLRTGESRPVTQRVSEWYDQQSRTHRVRDELDGVPVSDIRGSTLRKIPNAAFTEVALSKFVRQYKSLLAGSTGHSVRRGRVGGVPVFWIPFARTAAFVSVAVSVQTFKPVVIVARDGGATRRLHVVEAGSLAIGVRVPRPEAPPRQTTVAPRETRLVTSAAAARSGLTAGSILSPTGGFGLLSIRLVHFTGSPPAGDFVYGKSKPRNGAFPASFIRAQESTQPEPYFGWTRATAALVRNGGIAYVERDGRIWIAYLRGQGRYFRLMSSTRASIVSVARALSVAR
jgi:hypothetical protein